MRFLGIGDYASLGSVYMRLLADGHEVKVHIAFDASKDVLRGLVHRVTDWKAELPWVRAAGRDGIILFESAQSGHIQDALRAEGYNVIGGSAFGDRLEMERAFGQQIMTEAGMRTAPIHTFHDFAGGIAFIQRNPGRYVYKPNGNLAYAMESYVGQMDGGEDVIAILQMQERRWREKIAPDFILMQHLSGVEVGVGAYFNGEEFLEPACIDWEHKRFFAGDMGELTGEMGTLVSYEGSDVLFAATLARVAPLLARGGYCGYININCIANSEGIWPLEFTARFGYPGSAILGALQAEGWDALFARIVKRDNTTFQTHPGYGVGVVLTVPPFPYDATDPPSPNGLPILFRGTLSQEDESHMHYSELALEEGRLITASVTGQVMVVTGRGPTPQDAKCRAYALAEKVVVPNLRYRLDIGDRFLKSDHKALINLGILPA